MAYYRLRFEGKDYVSKDAFKDVLGVKRAPQDFVTHGKVIFSTAVYGPVSKEDVKLLDRVGVIVQDIDAALASFVTPEKNKEYTVINSVVPDDKVFTYKGKAFMLLYDVTHPKKYALKDRFALVPVCGRTTYVCLDVVKKDVIDPIIITRI